MIPITVCIIRGRKETDMKYIGVDIGGTNIKLGLVDLEGEDPVIMARSAFLFDHKMCSELCGAIKYHTEIMAADAGIGTDDILGIGLSVPGSIDREGESILHSYNMGYHNVPIKAELQKLFPGKKISMANDANAAAFAELHAGSLKGCLNALLLTIGTGLGSGLILDGKVFNGGQGRGCELGHMTFKVGGIPCNCGQSGCMDVYLSATRIAREGREILGEEYADAKAVLDLSKKGDPTAKKIMDSYLDDLSTAIAALCATFDPERIALGGGFSAAGDALYVPLNKLVAQKNFHRIPYEIVPARFLNDAGVLGAAYHVHLT